MPVREPGSSLSLECSGQALESRGQTRTGHDVYQSVGYRWARNLAACNAAEPQRFVAYYDRVAPDSALMLTAASRIVGP